MIIKGLIRQRLQERAHESHRSTPFLRRETLWKHDTLDQDLKVKIEALDHQEPCLAEWRNHSYSYNAKAEH